MIKWTLKKIKDTLDAVASIAKSFSSIVASVVASITVAFTGYKEVKKIIHSGKHEKTSEAFNITDVKTKSTAGNVSVGKETVTSVIQTSTGMVAGEKYEMDTNTAVLSLAVVILPLIWYFEKKRKKNDVKS